MSITSAWVGKITHNSARVISKTDGDNIRLAVSKTTDFADPIVFNPHVPTEQDVVSLDAANLDSETEYLYRIWDDTNGLVLTGVAGTNATTPDDASLDMTGDFSIKADATITDPGTGNQTLVAKFVEPSDRAYMLRWMSTGSFRLNVSTDGSDGPVYDSPSFALSAGERFAVWAEFELDDGGGTSTATFYTAPTIDGPWSVLGSDTRVDVSTINASTAVVEAGTWDEGANNPFAGTIHAIKLEDGIGDNPTVVLDTLFYAPRDGVDSFNDLTGKSWSVNGAAEIEGAINGRFNTHVTPGTPKSFTFIAAGDAGLGPDFPDTTGEVLASDRISNAPTFDTIREHNPLFFIHLGDLHYYDLGLDLHGITGGGTVDNFRRAYDDVLLQTRQHQLYREIPSVYVWDNHDGMRDQTELWRPSAAQAYRERVPSYDLPDPEAIYHSFEVGRCLFIVLDTRYYRSPNEQLDDTEKTMLGDDQKAWLEDLLQTSESAFAFIISSVGWIGTPNGTGNAWRGYNTERTEIGVMLEQYGWADKAIVLSGDTHTLAIDSGAGNEWPEGMPTALLASIDASPSGVNSGFDIGISNDRRQYGKITVTDQGGDTLSVTLDGYNHNDVLFSHTIFLTDIPAPDPEPDAAPEPGPPLTELPVGVLNPVVQWASFDLITGELIADLPDLEGSIGRLLGAHTSTRLRMPIPLSGDSALGKIAFDATTPGRTLIVAIVNEQPCWGGRVVARQGGTSGTLEVATSTLEAYLTRRRVQTHVFNNNSDEAEVMTTLFQDAGPREIEGLGLVGGINLEIDAPNVGVVGTGEYSAIDRATVYDAIRERSARDSGLEWTIELIWGNDEHTKIRKVIRVAPRIGSVATIPEAVFETTVDSVFESRSGNEATYTYDEDYSDGRGATWVEAYSTGEGEDQPASDPAIATELIANGWPIDEHHFQTDATVQDKSVLDSHATEELSLMKNGSRTWEIESRWNVFPQLNIHWRLGDDVGWKLVGHRHPEGIVGQGRCIGWDLDAESGTIIPTLLDPLSEGV